jgi:hypothetical protein
MTRTHFRFHWPATPQAAASVRRTAEVLPVSIDRERFEDLRLLLSEAVLGLVDRSGGPAPDQVEVGVSVAENDLRAEVTLGDGASTRPAELSGWGMLVVDSLSSAWGLLREPGPGIWFELPFGFRRNGSRRRSSSRMAA